MITWKTLMDYSLAKCDKLKVLYLDSSLKCLMWVMKVAIVANILQKKTADTRYSFCL